MTERRMQYSQYKLHYADCDTLAGSYWDDNKSIVVLIPDGRMKASGVRGERYKTVYLNVGDDSEHTYRQGFRAITGENAVKQAKKYYKYVQGIA